MQSYLSLRKIIILFIFSGILLTSCRNNLQEGGWPVNLLVPVAHSSLSIRDLVPDSLSGMQNDSLLTLVFQQELFEIEPVELLNMPDTHYQFKAYLDSIRLGNIELEEKVTMGDILIETGYAIFIPNGSVIALPPLSGISSNNIQINASQYFTTMTLSQGFLDIRIINQLPIDITNLVFEVLNADDLSMISRDTFDIIPSDSESLKTLDMQGKTIRGQMIANILNMDSPGSGGVPVQITYADAIISRLKVYDLKPYEATAIFPAQDLVNKGDKVYFNIGEIALNYIEAVEGFLSIQSYNTIEDPVHFEYKIPGLQLNGAAFQVSGTIPAAQNGVATFLNQVHDVSGYSLDLRGAGPYEQMAGTDLNGNGMIDNDTINTVFVLARASIDSTGNLIHLSLQDSFIFRSALSNLIPLYAQGYLGRDTLSVTGVAEFELPEILRESEFQLSDAKLGIGVSNQFGFSSEVEVNEVSVVNTNNSQALALDISQLNSLSISAPPDPHNAEIPVSPTFANYQLTNLNSNIADLISLIPNQMNYDFDVFVNAQNPPPPIGAGTDFMYNSSRLKGSLDVEIPLSFLSASLNLKDTFSYNLGNASFSEISEAKLFFIFTNSIPFNADLSIELWNSVTGNNYELVLNSAKIEAGVLIDGSSSVLPHKTVIEIQLNQSAIEFLQEADAMIVEAVFYTSESGTSARIYENQKLDVAVSADLRYTSNPNQ